MSRPSMFKRRKTAPDELPSRSASPAGSFSGGLRPLGPRPSRSASPTGSLYSQASVSSPALTQLPTPPPISPESTWLPRSSRPSTPSVNIISPTDSEFASPPASPLHVSDAELRRRQLEKATRILGEYVPLELVFKPEPLRPLAKHFPDPPPRRESPVPRELLAERRVGKIARRASLSLSTFTSKLRGTPPPPQSPVAATHSRGTSQESASTASASGSSEHSHTPPPRTPPSPASAARTLPRRGSLVLGSPIRFAFPRARTPFRVPSPSSPPVLPAPEPEPALVLDISAPVPAPGQRLDIDTDDEDEATPVRAQPQPHPYPLRHVHSRSELAPRPAPRAPLYAHAHADSEQLPATATAAPFMRPATPLAAARAENETAFADYYSRPATPAPLRARPTTPFADYYNDDGDVEPESESELMGPGAGVSRRERGQGWSGEWNQRDMQAVIAKLRSLK